MFTPHGDHAELVRAADEGYTVHLWVVRGGALTEGFPLADFLRNENARTRLDWNAVAAAVPPLPEPKLAPNQAFTLRFDGPRPDPDWSARTLFTTTPCPTLWSFST